MSCLLDNLPDLCTVRRRVRTKGPMGGSKANYTTEQTNVKCWQQQTGSSTSVDFEKKGMSNSTKVYFVEDPGVTARHQILITSRNGIALAVPVPLDVDASPYPDVSVGRGMLWKVDCSVNAGEYD